jgi:hypothetical protein
VDLNHRPRPYQGLLWSYMHSIMRLPAKQVRRLLFSARKSVKTAEDARGPMSFVFCLSRRWVIRIRQETEYSCCHVSGFRVGDLARRKLVLFFSALLGSIWIVCNRAVTPTLLRSVGEAWRNLPLPRVRFESPLDRPNCEDRWTRWPGV